MNNTPIGQPTNDINSLIGKAVKYYDYLDLERFGHIVAVEPYPIDPEQAYIYIEDNEPEFNIHQDFVAGSVIRYAEIRPSGQVYIDE